MPKVRFPVFETRDGTRFIVPEYCSPVEDHSSRAGDVELAAAILCFSADVGRPAGDAAALVVEVDTDGRPDVPYRVLRVRDTSLDAGFLDVACIAGPAFEERFVSLR